MVYPAAPDRRRAQRGGLTLVEICMAVGILLLLVVVSVTNFDDILGDTRFKAARADLDALRGEVVRWQMERRADYGSDLVVGREGAPPKDPWGAPYRVDPSRRLVYSVGPNGVDDRGDGDDVSLAFDRYLADELKPPTDFRVTDHGEDWVALSWNPVRLKGGITGYNLYRRASFSQSTYTTVPIHPQPIGPTDQPGYKDTELEAGQVYYYSLEVVAPDGTRARSPSQVGHQPPARIPPVVELSPTFASVVAGEAVTFTIRARAVGSKVTDIVVDGESQKLPTGNPAIQVVRTYPLAGEFVLEAKAVDERGLTGLATGRVHVRPGPR